MPPLGVLPPFGVFGVGHGVLGVVELPNIAASVRDTPGWALLPSRLLDPLDLASPLVGVGHAAAIAVVAKFVYGEVANFRS